MLGDTPRSTHQEVFSLFETERDESGRIKSRHTRHAYDIYHSVGADRWSEYVAQTAESQGLDLTRLADRGRQYYLDEIGHDPHLDE